MVDCVVGPAVEGTSVVDSVVGAVIIAKTYSILFSVYKSTGGLLKQDMTAFLKLKVKSVMPVRQ